MTQRRIAVVASELLGVAGTGGPGTADSLLAIALGRHGHDVELLVAPGRDVSSLNEHWQSTYASANVRIRALRDDASVRPSFLAPTAHVYDALRDEPPDVVVADDWRALAYAALRSRQLGLSLAGTAFVLYCHGPARVFAAAAQKVPDTVARFGEEVAQRACLELADVVVSPSEWLVEWLRAHRWPVPESARVIQNLWESAALGEPVQRVARASPIRRLAFFGQLREGKGIRVFLESLRRLDPPLLDGVDLVFVGNSRTWTEAALREELAGVTQSLRLETQLDQTAAHAELKVPGTLAVMPSLLENSPYAVAECIEHGIPFVAADVGGTPELVADEDRGRVLCPPTPDHLATALERVLTSDDGVESARPARPPEESLGAWLELIATAESPPRPAAAAASRVAVVAHGQASRSRARRLAERTQSAEVDATADWILFLDDRDMPDDALIDRLVAAQAASGADVVTCAVREDQGGRRLFLGDPGPLGLIENQYGVIGLIRRSLLTSANAVDSDWVLFARLALGGARILSVPDSLSVHAARPASAAERLAVLEVFETAAAGAFPELPQLTATLAAALARAQTDGVAERAPLLQRIRRRLLR